jgi:N-acetylmuramoyl-L-alanine amidase
LLEKNVCLEVALRLGQLIEDELPGSEVIYTRNDDQNISPQHRGDVANESGADLFVSIHADSLGDGQGPQVYYPGGAEKKSAGSASERASGKLSLQLAADIQAALAQQFTLKGEATPTRVPTQPAFAALSNLQVPVAIVEIPFTNEGPLLDPTQRQKLAEALSRGITTFVREHPDGLSPKTK